jgi:hypothetical protein
VSYFCCRVNKRDSCFINTNSSDSRFATVMSQSVGGGGVTEFPRPSARRPGMPQRGNYRAEPPRRHCTVQQTTYAASPYGTTSGNVAKPTRQACTTAAQPDKRFPSCVVEHIATCFDKSFRLHLRIVLYCKFNTGKHLVRKKEMLYGD